MIDFHHTGFYEKALIVRAVEADPKVAALLDMCRNVHLRQLLVPQRLRPMLEGVVTERLDDKITRAEWRDALEAAMHAKLLCDVVYAEHRDDRDFKGGETLRDEVLAYVQCVHKVLAGDVGSIEEGVKFANKFRRQLQLTDAEHEKVINDFGWTAYHWKTIAPEAVVPLQFRKKEAAPKLDLVDDYEVPDPQTFAKAGSDDHHKKFGYDYGPENSFSRVMYKARAAAKTVKDYTEYEPEPEPEPEKPFVHPDWSDDSEPEPEPEAAPEVAPAPAPAAEEPRTPPRSRQGRGALVGEKLKEAVRIVSRDDVAAVEAAVRDQMDAFAVKRGWPWDVRVDLLQGRLVVARQKMIKWAPMGDTVRNAEGRAVVEEMRLALHVLDEECERRQFPLTVTVSVRVRCGDDRPLSQRQRDQANVLSLQRARALVSMLLVRGSVREESTEAVAGGVAAKPAAPAVEVGLALRRRVVLPVVKRRGKKGLRGTAREILLARAL